MTKRTSGPRRRFLAGIDPTGLPPETQLELARLHADIESRRAEAREKVAAISAVGVIAVVIAFGAIWLASRRLPAPEFLAPVMATLAGALAMMLGYQAGRAHAPDRAGG